MKKTNLYAILPLAAASLAFTGCNTTQKVDSGLAKSETYVMGISGESQNKTSLIQAQRAENLELKIRSNPIPKDSENASSTYFFSYGDPTELHYASSFDDTISLDEDSVELTVDNDLLRYVNQLDLWGLPNLVHLYERGSEVGSKTREYTHISRSTSSGIDFDTDFDVWDPMDSKVEISKTFRNGSKLVLEGTPDDKEYAKIVYTIPWNSAVKPVQAVVAWIKY